MSRKQPAKCKQPERARLIALLGWAPEPPVAAERYCATTGELWQTAVEQCGRDAADAARAG